MTSFFAIADANFDKVIDGGKIKMEEFLNAACVVQEMFGMF